MGEEPVVAGGDAEAGQQPHENAGRDLDPGDAVSQDVPGDRDGGRDRGEGQKRARYPRRWGGGAISCGVTFFFVMESLAPVLIWVFATLLQDHPSTSTVHDLAAG